MGTTHTELPAEIRYNSDLRAQYEWERTVGKDFPITWNGMVLIFGLTVVALFLWLLHGISSAVDDFFKERDEKKKRADALQIETMRLKRERLLSRREADAKRKPKFEVIEVDETKGDAPTGGQHEA